MGRDAAVDVKDAQTDANMNTDAGFVCKREGFPLWRADLTFETRATRLPLDVYCKGSHCPSSLQDYLQTLTCEDLDDGGIQDIAMGNDISDGGNANDLVLRSEGCGRVQFHTIHPAWPRDYNFDAASGKLIGAARLDDAGFAFPGTPCEDAGYVAGEFRASCPGEVLKLCTYH